MSRIKEISTDESSSISSGYSITRTFEGPAEDWDEFNANEAPAIWVERRKSYTDLGKWLKVDYVYTAANADGTENPGESGLKARTWELEYQEEQYPILSHRWVQGDQFGAAGTTGMRQIYAAWPSLIEAYAAVYRAKTEEFSQNIADGGSGSPPDPAEYIALIRSHLPSIPAEHAHLLNYSDEIFTRLANNPSAIYTMSVPTLRKVEVVTSLSELSANHANADKVHTYAQLLAAEPTLPSVALIDVTGLQDWKWLKVRPKVQQTDNGLFAMPVDYVGLRQYDTFQYEAVT